MDREWIHKPHDKLVKATLANVENARAFFERYLDAELLPHVRWGSLSLLSSTFVDPQFSASESDLLFSVDIGGVSSRIYILLEHQSTEDERIAFRVLSYVLRIWERFTQETPPSVKLPPVFPLVLVQSKVPWKTSPRLEDIIRELPFLKGSRARWLPCFEFCVEELSKTPFEHFKGTPESVLMLRLLKAAAGGELLGEWVWDEGLLERVSADALERWVRYIFAADISRDVFVQRLRTLKSAFMKTKSMSLADQFIEFGKQEGWEKGRQEGWQEGRQEGRLGGLVESAREAVLQALEIKHGLVPGEVRLRLESISDLPYLRKLLEHALLSESVQEFAHRI